jgi:hypothetical protein
MSNTIIIRKTFASRDDAHSARDRLEYGGFPRESIAVFRVGERFELAIHTRPEHAQRVQDCINSSNFVLQAAHYGSLLREHAPSAGQSMLLLGGIAATAVALVYAFRRNRQRWLEDTGNIDRRWDRPDRLADTEQEDERWNRGERFRPSDDGWPGLRSDATGYGT